MTKKAVAIAVALILGTTMIWFFGSSTSGKNWQTGNIPVPWEQSRPSIYEFVKNHIEPNEFGLSEGGDILPDEAIIMEGKSYGWVPGAFDGVFGFHTQSGSEQRQVEKVFAALENALKQPTDGNMRQLYELVRDDNTLEIVDPLLVKIVSARSNIDPDRLQSLGRLFATQAPDRGAVKFGLAIIGLIHTDDNLELLHTLGRHEEFTLYAASALNNREQDAEAELWKLAKQVRGWGRIHIVERLAGTENPELKAWLLRKGYRNDIMNEYLAYTAATTGGLLAELQNPSPDEDLLRGAGGIIDALIQGGPAEDMDDYAEGAEVVARYLSHAKERNGDLDLYLIVTSIREFVNDAKADWQARGELGWTRAHRETIANLADDILSRPGWSAQVLTELESDDRAKFWRARRAAGEIGIDTWEYSFRRQETGESDEWYFLMQTNDPTKIDRVIALAERMIPLEQVATGAELEMGFGSEFKHHSALDYIVQDIKRFPGKGWTLVKTALNSPLVRNRNMAINALAEWGEDNWPGDARAELEKARNREPDDEVKDRLTRLLDGRPLVDD